MHWQYLHLHSPLLTSARAYSHTVVQLYSCTVVQLYSCKVVQLYSCTEVGHSNMAAAAGNLPHETQGKISVHEHLSCVWRCVSEHRRRCYNQCSGGHKVVKLYSCTAVQLYSCTEVGHAKMATAAGNLPHETQGKISVHEHLSCAWRWVSEHIWRCYTQCSAFYLNWQSRSHTVQRTCTAVLCSKMATATGHLPHQSQGKDNGTWWFIMWLAMDVGSIENLTTPSTARDVERNYWKQFFMDI